MREECGSRGPRPHASADEACRPPQRPKRSDCFPRGIVLHKWPVKTTFDITEAQARLPKLVRSRQTVSVSSHDKTVAFIVPRARMEALLETMEILANPAAMRAIRRDQSGKGKYLPLSALDEDKG